MSFSQYSSIIQSENYRNRGKLIPISHIYII